MVWLFVWWDGDHRGVIGVDRRERQMGVRDSCERDDGSKTGQTNRSVNCSDRGLLMRMFGEDMAPPNDVGYTQDPDNAVMGRLRFLLRFLDSNSSTDDRHGRWASQVHRTNHSVGRFMRVGGRHTTGSLTPVLKSKEDTTASRRVAITNR